MDSRDDRPSPDALLRAARREARGRLKIFLGAAPGVGKTFEMLREGAERLRAGTDVGGRRRRDARPRRDRGAGRAVRDRAPPHDRLSAATALEEMDLDAVLARRPALALVDEFAHSNVEGQPPPQALAGRRGAARRRHRRLHHAQRPARREPERRRRQLHPRPRARDGARLDLRRRRDRDRRPAARRADRAAEGGQGLCPRRGDARARPFLLQGQPVGAARDGAAAGGAERRSRHARPPRRPRRRRHLCARANGCWSRSASCPAPIRWSAPPSGSPMR